MDLSPIQLALPAGRSGTLTVRDKQRSTESQDFSEKIDRYQPSKSSTDDKKEAKSNEPKTPTELLDLIAATLRQQQTQAPTTTTSTASLGFLGASTDAAATAKATIDKLTATGAQSVSDLIKDAANKLAQLLNSGNAQNSGSGTPSGNLVSSFEDLLKGKQGAASDSAQTAANSLLVQSGSRFGALHNDHIWVGRIDQPIANPLKDPSSPDGQTDAARVKTLLSALNATDVTASQGTDQNPALSSAQAAGLAANPAPIGGKEPLAAGAGGSATPEPAKAPVVTNNATTAPAVALVETKSDFDLGQGFSDQSPKKDKDSGSNAKPKTLTAPTVAVGQGTPTSAASTASAPPKAITVDTVRDVSKQIIDQAKEFMEARRPGKVTVILQPEGLGTVSVSVKQIGQRFEADIQASDGHMRQALVNHKSELVSMAESKGMKMDGYNVGQDPSQDQGKGQKGGQAPTRQEWERANNLSSYSTDQSVNAPAATVRLSSDRVFDTTA